MYMATFPLYRVIIAEICTGRYNSFERFNYLLSDVSSFEFATYYHLGDQIRQLSGHSMQHAWKR